MCHIVIAIVLYRIDCTMSKNPKKKNAKDAKPSSQKSSEKKVEPRKAAGDSVDLPATQSKEVLLLDYDHGRAFAKRKVESNWDRYGDLSDEEENPQLLAAEFDKILLAPQSIGEHFKFASERAWDQTVNADSGTDPSSHDLFKMNLNNLKNGVGRLPFYIRNDLPLELFDDDEITDMNYRANYYPSTEKQPPQTTSSAEHLSKLLIAEESSAGETHKAPSGALSVKKNVKLPESITKLAESTASFTVQASPPPKTAPAAKKANESENIQDWLDDILNDT